MNRLRKIYSSTMKKPERHFKCEPVTRRHIPFRLYHFPKSMTASPRNKLFICEFLTYLRQISHDRRRLSNFAFSVVTSERPICSEILEPFLLPPPWAHSNTPPLQLTKKVKRRLNVISTKSLDYCTYLLIPLPAPRPFENQFDYVLTFPSCESSHTSLFGLFPPSRGCGDGSSPSIEKRKRKNTAGIWAHLRPHFGIHQSGS